MKPLEIAFSCYAVTDVKRARAFYENVLGLVPSLVFEKENMAFIEYELGPHTLAIGAGATQFRPGPTGGVVALEVADFDQAVRELKDKNIPFVGDPCETPVCHMATVKDPDGNLLVIHQRKAPAPPAATLP